MFEALLSLALSGFLFFVLHVAGSGSFPRPLTAQEEKECLEKMKNGDPKAKAALIEHNLRLVAHIIKKYYSSSSEQDDLISIGTIGLIKAVNTFDSSKGIRLSSYAARCIENAILSFRTPVTRQKEGRLLRRPLFLPFPKNPSCDLFLLFHRTVNPLYVLRNRAAVDRGDPSLQFLLFFPFGRIVNKDIQPLPSIA
ncbi:sigma-70 family RNA polymerase sigma factor [Caproiciproducens sp. NJN-50]|uniref:sigma-70 family RNA polymerase sigma factor n=1 Tax=Caproiciproducens sp. NJN-50 TaxID=2507162 RepID=UPI000FFE1DA9|nr:sigma-70 family RNA polymerase sigma factor [Caproiciproducens sp. NJN-50]QAT49039.1 sigma-70 family RNA polymerase sigma factor [Caproiciproducens sp. NJN-50]